MPSCAVEWWCRYRKSQGLEPTRRTSLRNLAHRERSPAPQERQRGAIPRGPQRSQEVGAFTQTSYFTWARIHWIVPSKYFVESGNFPPTMLANQSGT